MNDQLLKIAERIQKLLNLAGNNPSKEEAAMAAAKASALLAEHNLSLSEIQAVAGANGKEEKVEEEKFTVGHWTRWMRQSAAGLNFCTTVYSSTGKKDYKDLLFLIGKPSNVASAKVLIEYLEQTGWRLSKQHSKIRKEQHAFLLGFSHELSIRLRALKEERSRSATVSPATGNTLPALANLYDVHEKANQSAMAQLHPSTRQVQAKLHSSAFSSAAAGRQAGKQVNLSPQIGGANANRPKQIT